MKLTTITHTRNSAALLPRMLATTGWVDERIIVDMDSSDDTLELAKQAGCRIFHTPVAARIDGIRNDYLGYASHAWTLVLDSDEYLADDAEQAIAELIAECDAGSGTDSTATSGPAINAISIPRFNTIGGQLMRGSGWYPDHQIRLFRSGQVRWSDRNHQPPEVVGGRSALRILEPPGCLHIHHQNYRDLREVLSRQLGYALDDHYDDDPASYDFDDYVSRAYQAFAARHHPEDDGELSTALATIMAWDALLRGLIHWDRLDRQPSLERAFTLPVVAVEKPQAEIELARLRQRLAELELAQAELALIKGSATWRISRGLLRRFPRIASWAGQGFRKLRG